MSRIKSNSFVRIGRCTNYLQKVIPARISNVHWFFVIRNNSGVQIFRNDEKARQRHLPKMYTLVLTMNWNRFRKIFRIRFCIFYNRSELSHCVATPGSQILARIFAREYWPRRWTTQPQGSLRFPLLFFSQVSLLGWKLARFTQLKRYIRFDDFFNVGMGPRINMSYCCRVTSCTGRRGGVTR